VHMPGGILRRRPGHQSAAAIDHGCRAGLSGLPEVLHVILG
jgi:hypothetical protein